ncbi:MAG: hypothetical protein QXL51_00970 [Candidatus Aenigmatarchaeota archaeon]
MAFTSTNVKHGVMGDLRYEIYSWKAVSVTGGSIITGLSTILHCNFENQTAQRGTISISGNTVSLSALTAGDTGTIMVFGY